MHFGEEKLYTREMKVTFAYTDLAHCDEVSMNETFQYALEQVEGNYIAGKLGVEWIPESFKVEPHKRGE